ncbi:UPF0481 protein At3g47200-like [Impatiens glandulifera]|uniref:UPF0481 protein At3g47200-like n=1 Tax=Impatiens glandulifera TaxID=253017 RepID=UPI001FB1768C|nr:UPF0481 protein At3g47200-like [Impatiens glandulifera]
MHLQGTPRIVQRKRGILRAKPHLDSLKEHKFSYLNHFLQRNGQSVDRYVEAVMPEVKRVRKCYGGSNERLPSDEQLVQMLVVDGCFIIEFLLKFDENLGTHDDPLINSNVLFINALQNDLLLIDNQIPFFILQILYSVKSSTYKDSSNEVLESDMKLKHLTLQFLYCKYGMSEPRDINIPNINIDIDNDRCHLLDIAHSILSSNKNVDYVDNLTSSYFVNSATKLEEANVMLKAVKKFGSIFDIEFDRGKLTIPCFSIDEHFEIEIKNFIALELCQHKPIRNHLIASSDDVNLLIKRGIITNHMIDAKFVDNMFMKLTKNIVTSEKYTYSENSENLNEYCKNKRHKHWRTSKEKYFQSPWSLMSLIAASTLIGLIFIQTLFTIISK